MASIQVLKPGLLTTVQDRGRWGHQALGVPVAGPMDPCSLRVANAIVGNEAGAAALEITQTGPELEFDDERLAAVAGAEFELTIDGRAVPRDASFTIAARQRLRFGSRVRGTRAYLAISGGIDAPPVMGSRATHVLTGIGGRPLRAGDSLALGPASRARRAGRTVPRMTPMEAPARVRVMAGPQADYFADSALETLASAPYRVGLVSDRMAFRLEGPLLPHTRGADIISDATPLGSLQVPASGQPILLMADRQTTGGYAKLATVITADIGAAGQLGPGDSLTFTVCSLPEAMAALIAQERALLALES